MPDKDSRQTPSIIPAARPNPADYAVEEEESGGRGLPLLLAATGTLLRHWGHEVTSY